METLKTENSVTSTFLTKLLKKWFCYEVYSFELNLLIIHLRNYEAFFCFKLIFTKEYWNLVSYLTFKNWKYRTRTSNRIFHESKNPINNRTRTTFSINRLVPLYLLDECAKTFFFYGKRLFFNKFFPFVLFFIELS